MVNNVQNLVNVVKGRPQTRGLRHRLCELLQLQFSLSFRSGLTFGWNELLLYLCRSRGSIVYLDIFFHFLYSFCLYICVLNKRCTIQRLSLFVYTANIFKVIFTVFNCVRISTVISLYGLHFIAAPSTV